MCSLIKCVQFTPDSLLAYFTCTCSYTLECNYNSGRQSNAVSSATCDNGQASPALHYSPMPHRYCIASFEQVQSYMSYVYAHKVLGDSNELLPYDACRGCVFNWILPCKTMLQLFFCSELFYKHLHCKHHLILYTIFISYR